MTFYVKYVTIIYDELFLLRFINEYQQVSANAQGGKIMTNIPVSVHIEGNKLKFKTLENGLYWPENGRYTGDWVESQLRTQEENNVRIYINNKQVIIEEEVGEGNWKEIVRFKME